MARKARRGRNRGNSRAATAPLPSAFDYEAFYRVADDLFAAHSQGQCLLDCAFCEELKRSQREDYRAEYRRIQTLRTSLSNSHLADCQRRVMARPWARKSSSGGK